MNGESLAPRTRIASVGYALSAEYCDTADYARAAPVGDDGDWTVSGVDLYASVSGNEGIGTASPVARLQLETPAGAALRGAHDLGKFRPPRHRGVRRVVRERQRWRLWRKSLWGRRPRGR